MEIKNLKAKMKKMKLFLMKKIRLVKGQKKNIGKKI